MIKKPRILVTNDDGVHAPGILALAQSVSSLGEIIIAAPETEKSAVGHAITISDPIKVQEINLNGEFKAYSISGTPADCVKIAVQSIMDEQPDIVVSGINMGANVGYNIMYSGTVSAATEGTLLGIPSLAISLDTIRDGNFSAASKYAEQLTQLILENGLPIGTLLNANIPNVSADSIKGIKVTSQGKVGFRDWFERREDPRGRVYYWMSGEIINPDNEPHYDSIALKEQYVSLTPIRYDLTDNDFLNELKSWKI